MLFKKDVWLTPYAMMRTLHTTSGGTLPGATGSRVVPFPSGTAG